MPILGRSYLPSRVIRSTGLSPLRGPLANWFGVARMPVPRPHALTQANRTFAPLRGSLLNRVQLTRIRPPAIHALTTPFRAFTVAVPPVSTSAVFRTRYRAPLTHALANSVSILNLPPPPANLEVITYMQIVPYRYRRGRPSRLLPYRLVPRR